MITAVDAKILYDAAVAAHEAEIEAAIVASGQREVFDGLFDNLINVQATCMENTVLFSYIDSDLASELFVEAYSVLHTEFLALLETNGFTIVDNCFSITEEDDAEKTVSLSIEFSFTT